MSRELELTIDQLVPKATTRARGKEAAQMLRTKTTEARASRVYLDTRSTSLVTGSFIDELAQQAAQMAGEGGPEIVFTVDDDALGKLQNTATWRSLTCQYRRAGETDVHTLRPGRKAGPITSPEVVSKAELFATTS